MIEREGPYQWLVCEECGDRTEAFHRDEFDQMMSVAKGEGWSITKDRHGTWEHHCSGCSHQEDRVTVAKRLLGFS